MGGCYAPQARHIKGLPGFEVRDSALTLLITTVSKRVKGSQTQCQITSDSESKHGTAVPVGKRRVLGQNDRITF